MSHRNALTVAQLLVLRTAAERPDHLILPLPPTIRVRGATQRNLLAALPTKDLVEEITVGDAAAAWRTNETGQHIGLRLTAAGLATAGDPHDGPPPADLHVTQEEVSSPSCGSPITDETLPTELVAEAEPSSSPRHPTGKLGEVLRSISAQPGATLSEITTLTGWLPHTARAAVTGLRQRGFAIQLSQADGRKAYRLVVGG